MAENQINLKNMLEVTREYKWSDLFKYVEKVTTQLNRQHESLAQQAQMIHQAYHGWSEDTWEECTMDSCRNFREMQKELKKVIG